MCKKQTAQSHSTPEAEIVALDAGVRTVGIPSQQLWKVLLRREPTLRVWEDNEATIKIIRSGRVPAMRPVKRVHGISIMSLHDSLHRQTFQLEDGHTDVQAADIFTKPFTHDTEWEHRCELFGIVAVDRLPAARPLADDGKSNNRRREGGLLLLCLLLCDDDLRLCDHDLLIIWSQAFWLLCIFAQPVRPSLIPTGVFSRTVMVTAQAANG